MQATPAVAQDLSRRVTAFVHPLLKGLDAVRDLRVVQPLLATRQVLLAFRPRNNGLLNSLVRSLSRRARSRSSRDHTPLERGSRSARWTAHLIERDLGQQAESQVVAFEQAGEEALLLWDERVIEKPESIAKDRLVCGAFE